MRERAALKKPHPQKRLAQQRLGVSLDEPAIAPRRKVRDWRIRLPATNEEPAVVAQGIRGSAQRAGSELQTEPARLTVSSDHGRVSAAHARPCGLGLKSVLNRRDAAPFDPRDEEDAPASGNQALVALVFVS